MHHPQLVPASVKEVNYLGLDAHWLNRSRYAERLYPFQSGGPGRGQLLGEASPFYLSSPVAPAQLRFLSPLAKFLVILRAPPDHCWSVSSKAVLRAAANLSRSGEAGSGICGRIGPRVPGRVLANYDPFDPRESFASNLARWLDYVDARRVLVLLLEALLADPAAQLARAWRFLGLSPWEMPPRLLESSLHAARNPHAKTPLPPAVRRALEECHAEPTRELERLLVSRMAPGHNPRPPCPCELACSAGRREGHRGYHKNGSSYGARAGGRRYGARCEGRGDCCGDRP